MAGPYIYDRVRETTTTTGTGTVTLAGAVTGYQSFAAVGNGNTCHYCIAHRTAAEWEVGIGTYTSSGTTLARTTVIASSNSNSAVNFSAGTKDVFVTAPAGQLVMSGGYPGGQTVIGGSASGENLSLQSTSHATRGSVLAKDALACEKSIQLRRYTPSQITSDQNDYDPGTTSYLRLSCDANGRAVTGFTGGADGRVLVVHNTGNNLLYLPNGSTGSSAANRLLFPNATGITLARDECAEFIYDAAQSLWLLKSATDRTPPGSIHSYGHTSSAVPVGYVEANGSNVSRTEYPLLFLIYGTKFGAGDGSTTFGKPDMRGRAPIGAGTGSGLTARTLADTGGFETHTLSTSEIPAHDHGPGSGTIFRNSSAVNSGHAAGGPTTGGVATNSQSSTTASTGGGGSHNNMQPFLVTMWIIRV